MTDRVIFAIGNKLGFQNQDSLMYLNSEYLQKYKKNREEINERYAWKTEGVSAAFRGERNPYGHIDYDDILEHALINGVAFMEVDQVIYSCSVETFSGIFIKSTFDDHETEGHVIHDNKTEFFNLDYSKNLNEAVVSISESGLKRNIARLDIKKSHLRTLTDGNSVDDNPVWSKTNPDTIYYDSKGFVMDPSEGISFGQTTINKLNLTTGNVEEIIAVLDHDCFLPKVDRQDNIYFLKKPYKVPHNNNNPIKDIALIPFRLSKAIFNWMNSFTERHTGETLITGGSNPAKVKQEVVFVNDDAIETNKSFKENQLSGEKFPGIAPRDWELWKHQPDGNLVCVRKGVISYDVNDHGEITYSNGKHLIKRAVNGHEELLNSIDLINKIRVF